MPHAQNSILERIRNALHVQYDETVREPLPERWVDLIRYLNEKDQVRSEAMQRGIGRLLSIKCRKIER